MSDSHPDSDVGIETAAETHTETDASPEIVPAPAPELEDAATYPETAADSGTADRTGRSDAQTAAETDDQIDAEIEAFPDSAGSGELPLMLSSRERFGALEDLPVTGEARVDAATARLVEVPDLPTTEHVTVYDDVHRRLQDALSDADVR